MSNMLQYFLNHFIYNFKLFFFVKFYSKNAKNLKMLNSTTILNIDTL